jgi:coenzyme F420-dependent glucose-6-phosphate dehydrogenase
MKVCIATAGKKVAELAGKYADGLLLGADLDQAKILFAAFEDSAKKAGRNPASLEKIVELPVSYDEDRDAALKSCRFWRGAMLPIFYRYDISDPREIEACGRLVGDEALARRWIVAATADEHIKRIQPYIDAGFDHLCFVSSSPDERKFIRFYAERVLPNLRE